MRRIALFLFCGSAYAQITQVGASSGAGSIPAQSVHEGTSAVFVSAAAVGAARPAQISPPETYTQRGVGASTRTVASKLQENISITDFGAVSGSTDNCMAYTNAMAAATLAGQDVLIPSGGVYPTSCTVTIPYNVSLIVNGTIQTLSGTSGTAATTLVSGPVPGGSNWVFKAITGTGTIDANHISAQALWLRFYAHVSLRGINIRNIPARGKGLRLGDSSTAGGGGFEAELQDVTFGDAGVVLAKAGSYCLYIDNGTDTQYNHGTLNGCAIGVQENVGASHYTDLHAWDKNMTTCFADAAWQNTWIGDVCDTPTTYGWHLSGRQTQIIGGTVENNTSYGTSNQLIAIQSDQADPGWTVSGLMLLGGHPIKEDTNVEVTNLTTTENVWAGVHYSNVTTKNMGPGSVLISNKTGNGDTNARYQRIPSKPVTTSAVPVSTVASESTITPASAVFTLTGTTPIATIIPAFITDHAAWTGCFDIFNTSALTTTTSGNIAAVYSLAAETPYRACRFTAGGKFYIK